MLSHHLIDATGVIALSLNVSALVRPSDRALLRNSGWASAIWAVNNLLIGAHTAAALSALSVGRQAGASWLQDHPVRTRAVMFVVLVAATLLIAGLTWNGTNTLFPVAGSLIASYAMLHLRGAALRWAMVLVNALWMFNAVAYDSQWQIAANALAGTAAAVGAWRSRAPAPSTLTAQWCAPRCAC
jgi:predicted acyltransferase